MWWWEAGSVSCSLPDQSSIKKIDHRLAHRPVLVGALSLLTFPLLKRLHLVSSWLKTNKHSDGNCYIILLKEQKQFESLNIFNIDTILFICPCLTCQWLNTYTLILSFKKKKKERISYHGQYQYTTNPFCWFLFVLAFWELQYVMYAAL